MEKRTAKAGIHEKDRSTTSSSVHTVMSSSAPSTTHLSILRGSEKKCTPILTIAPFFTITLVFFLFQGKTSTISACLFSTETVLSLTYRQTGRRTGRNCMAFGYLILHIPYTSKRRNCRWVEYLWKRRRGEKGYRPDPEGLFKGIEPLFPRRPSSLPWRPSSSLRAAGFTLYEVGLRGDEDGRREEKPRTSREWPPKGLIFDP